MRKLNNVLKKTGGEVYREITTVVLYSLISSAMLAAIVIFVPLIYALLLLPILYMPLLFGACYAYHCKTLRGKFDVKDVFSGAVKGFVPAVVIGFFFMLLFLILWSTWWYYGGKEGIGYLAISVFQTYFVIMAVISQFYTFQLVIQENIGLFKAMGRSVKLFLKFPGYTLGACFQAFCVAVPLLLTVVGFGCLFNGMWAVYHYKAVHNVLNPQAAQAKGQGALAVQAGSAGT